MRASPLRLASTSAALLLSSAAQASGVDTYDAPVSGNDLLQVARAHAETGHLEPFVRLSLAYNNDPIVWRGSDGSEVGVINQQAGAYPALGLALWGQFQIAALVPIYYQAGDVVPNQGSVDGVSVGDAALDLRLALLQRTDPIELSIASRIALPTGDKDRYVGDGHASASLGAIVSRQFGKDGLLLTSSITGKLRDRATASMADGGSALILGLGAAISVAPDVALTGEAELATEVTDVFGDTSTPASLLAGVRSSVGGWLAHLGAGPGLTRGVGSPDFRVVAMIGTDVDGETEAVAAPSAAVARDATDSDADGIDDQHDACVSEAEDKDAFADDDGCPELDNDKDSILDSSDKCPLEAEDKDAFQDDDGCPDLDNDQDSVVDSSDKCPLEAEDKDAFQDDDGCPDLDNDQDGLPDASDQCPAEKESPNGVDDADGCPDLLRVEQEQIRTLELIYFERGSDKLQARSLPLVQELAGVIASRQELGVVSIEGHTDNAGAEQSNLVLSQKRAQAIKQVLIAGGVPEVRLTATGYGEMRPIASNETRGGREQNRRVEFRLAGATGSATGSAQ